MLEYGDLETLNEETRRFIERTLYYLSRNIKMFVIKGDHTDNEFFATNRDERIIAMLAAYRELSNENDAFLKSNGVVHDFKLSMKRLTTDFNPAEEQKMYEANSRMFYIKDASDELSPEEIIGRNIRMFLRHDINNDFPSNLSVLFGGNPNMQLFSTALYEKAREKRREAAYSK